MAQYKTEFDIPFKINSDTQYYWETFIRQIKSGNSLAAVHAYHEFSKAREIVFNSSKKDKMEEIMSL